MPREEPPSQLKNDARGQKKVDLYLHPEKLTPRQREGAEFLAGPQRHSCLVGGARSGKSVLFCRQLVIRALKVPSRHAALRFRASAIWPSLGMTTFPFIMKTFFPEVTYKSHVARGYFEFPGGSEIWLGGLDDAERVDKILGNEYSTILFNECSQIPYASVVVALSRLAQNVGLVQRAWYDLNPSGVSHWTNVLFGEKRDPQTRKMLTVPEDYQRMFMNPRDNMQNLTKEYLESLENLPERARKRFFDGVYQEESANQLWKMSTIEDTRVPPKDVPALQRVIVAVDPSGAANDLDVNRDAIGIVAAALGVDGHLYVLDDATLLDGPERWGAEAVCVYQRWKADRIVGEQNFGGAMVEFVIKSTNGSVPFKMVTASRGKVQRAEPIATLYERRMVHHVGNFPEMEDEMSYFTDLGYTGTRSPNRADALIWALSELALSDSDLSGWVNYYRGIVEKAGVPLIERTRSVPASRRKLLGQEEPPDEVTVYTEPHASFYLSAPNGGSRQFTADAAGVIVAPVQFQSALLKVGCSLIKIGS